MEPLKGMSEGNVERKFWGSLGVYEKVESGSRVVMDAGPLTMSINVVSLAAAEARSYALI